MKKVAYVMTILLVAISFNLAFAGGEKLNINIANQQALSQLSGIGLKTAKKIVDYRNMHGFFNNIEEIKNVSGIGDKKFQKIKDMITVTGGVAQIKRNNRKKFWKQGG